MNSPETTFLDTKQVGEMLQISPNTLAAWRSLNKGPRYMQIGGGVVRYKQSDVVDWMNEQYASGTDASDVFEAPEAPKAPQAPEAPEAPASEQDLMAQAEALLDAVDDLNDLTVKNLKVVLAALEVDVPRVAPKAKLVELVAEALAD